MNFPEHLIDIKNQQQKMLLKKKNVIGVGIGLKEIQKAKTDEVCISVLVEKKEDVTVLLPKDLVPGFINGIKTDVKQIGKVFAQKPRTSRWRPARPGVSIGHEYVTAGTFGAVVRDAKTGEELILSNNHVLANSNDGQPGDIIIQPGKADGGQVPQDLIATLERFIKIQFQDDGADNHICAIAKGTAALLNVIAGILGSKSRLHPRKILTEPNLIDAAVAKPWQNNAINDDIYEIGKVTGTTEPAINLIIQKSGRTTGLTKGTIEVIDATVTVNYGNNRTALFEHQFLTNHMSEPGDSGSLGVTIDGNRAVGLLFAGSETVTVYCPIRPVLEKLNIKFD